MTDFMSLFIGVTGLGGSGWLGWISVQSFRQGARLSALPRSGGAAVEGQTLAARGKVKILAPLTIPGSFACLWYRERVESLRSPWLRSRWDSDDWRTTSDYARMATFSLVLDGMEIDLESLPTEVQGTQTSCDGDDRGMIGRMLGQDTTRRNLEWLPVRDEITVIGRLERRGDRHVLVQDPQLGLLLSPHPPDEAGNIETLKAVAGFVAVLLGGAASIWAICHALA
jgi:hypothetical protein